LEQAKHFDLAKEKIFFIACSVLAQNSGTKQSNLNWSGNSHRKSKMFLFNPKTDRLKQNILIWFAYYRNESKTF
jgi:hypothetical protein